MRYEVLWSLPVALFVCGLLLSSLGPPARAGDFNPQPEPPAEMKPDLNQPVPEEGIDPGAGKKLVHPPEKKGISPGNDKPHGLEEKGISPGNDKPHGLEEKGISPGNDKPHAPEVRPGPVPPGGKKAMEPLDETAIDPGDGEKLVHPEEEEVTSPRADQPTPKQPLHKKDLGDGGTPSDTLLY